MRKLILPLCVLLLTAFGPGIRLAVSQSDNNQPSLNQAAAPATSPYSSSSTEHALAASAVAPVASQAPSMHPFSKLGVGVAAGPLGIWVEGATPLANRLNLQAGVNTFSTSATESDNGLLYDGTLDLRSFDIGVAWFPFGGSFHLAPGVMVYNGTKLSANLQELPTGASIFLNGTEYSSDPSDALTGSGNITFPKAAPEVIAGFGNLIPRKARKHFSSNEEVGFAYFGTGKTSLTFSGSECTATLNGSICQKASSDQAFQANVAAKEAAIDKILQKYARFYPILRGGISYSF